MSNVSERDTFSEEVPAEEDSLSEDELEEIEFADNPEPRCPVLIIADCSGSMSGRPIDAMNQGVDDLYQAIVDDEIARNRVEVALLSFSTEARVERDFGTVDEWDKTRMRAGGSTNMHLAIEQGCDLLEERKEQYRRGGVPYFRPIMVVFSDGLPTSPRSEMERANQRLVDMENENRLTIFKVGVNGAAVQAMVRTLPNPNSRFQPQQLDNLRFSDFFVWLSKSVSAISRSTPGEAVNLPPTDWSTINV
ncbi:MAG: VWA domain-containing protein [Chloroflexi bacterium]|nr:VWA domain-containing protein [Chloroflexota bacterium]MYK36103.1 VWA domain-containing protein [Chloroflexota bacterium]